MVSHKYPAICWGGRIDCGGDTSEMDWFSSIGTSFTSMAFNDYTLNLTNIPINTSKLNLVLPTLKVRPSECILCYSITIKCGWLCSLLSDP